MSGDWRDEYRQSQETLAAAEESLERAVMAAEVEVAKARALLAQVRADLLEGDDS